MELWELLESLGRTAEHIVGNNPKIVALEEDWEETRGWGGGNLSLRRP